MSDNKHINIDVILNASFFAVTDKGELHGNINDEYQDTGIRLQDEYLEIWKLGLEAYQSRTVLGE